MHHHAVQTHRVICAAPGIETTSLRFEAIADKVQNQSLSSEIHKIESQFAKMIVTKLSLNEACKVTLKHMNCM